MQAPYQFKTINGNRALVHEPTGRVVAQATKALFTVYNPQGGCSTINAAPHASYKAMRKLQAMLNTRAVFNSLGI